MSNVGPVQTRQSMIRFARFNPAKKMILLCLCLAVSACFEIKDTEGVAKARVADSRLEGRWSLVNDVGDTKAGTVFTVSRKHPAEYPTYKSTMSTHPDEHQTATVYQFGKVWLFDSSFFGCFMRYEIVGDELRIFVIDVDAAEAFIQKAYPSQKKLKFGDSVISIETLDGQTIEMIERLAQRPELWETYAHLKKHGTKTSQGREDGAGQSVFVESCIPHHSKSQCECLAQTGQAAIPDIHTRRYRREIIQEIIQRNPLLALGGVVAKCGIVNY